MREQRAKARPKLNTPSTDRKRTGRALSVSRRPVESTVRKVLSSKRFYGDGSPKWREGKSNRPCQTSVQASAERTKLVKRLRRFGKGHPEALTLASRLESCRTQRRCKSAACPECARAWQRWFVTATVAFLGSEPTKLATVLSPIHEDGIVAPGDLHADALGRLKSTVKAALTQAGIRRGIFGVDISFNEDLHKEFEPHWLIHLRGIIPRRISKRVKGQLWSHFPKTEQIRKPRRSEEFDGDLSGIAYSMKPSFERRQSYVMWKAVNDGVRTCRNTRGRPLRGVHAVELAVFLDQLGLRARLMIGGARLTALDNGDLVIARKGKPIPKRNGRWFREANGKSV